jgi:integrase
MSFLEQRSSGQYHLVFRFGGRRFKRALKTAKSDRAEAARVRLDENLRLVAAGRLAIPEGADIPTFLLSDGKLNNKPSLQAPLTLSKLFEEYLGQLPEGAMESNSLYTAKIHMAHFERVLGKAFTVRGLCLEDLQAYVRERGKKKGWRNRQISPTTMRKELSTFSAVWSWAWATGRVSQSFPNKGLRFPKTTEKPPFQTREEVDRQIGRGELTENEQEALWDCLYLTPADLEKVLTLIKERADQGGQPVVYPMVLMAAHTGARRSEILRSLVQDFDLQSNVVVIHEKKRSKGRRTTRVVPISPLLSNVVSEWLKTHPRCKYMFCQRLSAAEVKKGTEFGPIAVNEATDLLRECLAGTGWAKIRGWHVFRHSFISNCASKGIDQRIIDAWSGHQTEEMRRRYTHLFPDSQQEAMRKLFGQSVDGQQALVANPG